jgi:hypothetical protein
MGFFDSLFGNSTPEPQRRAPERSDDEIAVERYRYLLRTAPPETVEQVHTEAFSKLTPEQRDILFDELSKNAAAGDAPTSKEPQALAVSATRSELRNPGTMERSLGGQGQGMGFGSMVASSLLGTVAGYVIGSAIVGAFLPDPSVDASADGTDASADSGADTSSAAGAEPSGDAGGFGDASGDFGGDFGDFGF